MISWIFLIIFAVLSCIYSWWFIIGIAVIGVLKLGHWQHYSSRPWRKVHFPMMLDYASASGLERRQADIDGREFNLNLALLHLLKIIDPKINISHKELIQRELQRCRDFYDKPLIRQYLAKKAADENEIELVLERIEHLMKDCNNGLRVRMVIASVIEEKYSPMDRGEYMYEVTTGSAN